MTTFIYNEYSQNIIEILIGSKNAIQRYISEWLPYEHRVSSAADKLKIKPYTQTFILSNVYRIGDTDPFYFDGENTVPISKPLRSSFEIINVQSMCEAQMIELSKCED